MQENREINLFAYETLAQTRLDPATWAYYAGGSDDEVTLRENRAAFERLRLRPRVLVDVSCCDLRTTVLGTPVNLPVLVAPTAFHALAHADGECATAVAAGRAGTVMVASSSATRTLEEIAQAASGPLWFQLYIFNRPNAEELVRRAADVGYGALVLTVDSPRWGHKERAERSGFRIPLKANVSDQAAAKDTQAVSWRDLDWLRSLSSLPLLLKGILTAEDAQLALEHGVDGIIVSNHGGRQLDGVPAAIEALPEVVEAVQGRCEVYMDGGIRRGTDVLKALALGARAVLLGRPVLWGLAVAGAQGAYQVLEILRTELELALALAGRPAVTQVDHSLLRLP
ncbi:MAG TPA: alpha-hydroxy acid oxidase [Ktedonobacteraceae bacterium]|jgi:isopentenyl diphosphate isomerase/L-lactate dehydrogenase-like FMN-dependent dehydrogenase